MAKTNTVTTLERVFQYNGMTFEKFAWQVIKTCFLCAGPRKWKSENYLYEALAGKEAKHD